MDADAQIASAIARLIDAAPVPELPLARIRSGIETARPARTPSARSLGFAAAAALALVAAPLVAPAIVDTVSKEYPALLRFFHLQPPPPIPPQIAAQLRSSSREVTFEQAQTQVPFALVAPAGLPADVDEHSISLASTASYTSKTRTWKQTGQKVAFIYHRRDGRSFTIMADRYDPAEHHPAFIYEEIDGPHGATFVKHQNFAWRNGSQVALIAAGPGISAAEIEAIRAAMHGEPLALSVQSPAKGFATIKYRALSAPAGASPGDR